MPCGTSMGKDAAGNYLTAELKEYPPLFCKAIAESLIDSVAEAELVRDRSVEQALAYRTEQVMPHDVYWEMGDDFLE